MRDPVVLGPYSVPPIVGAPMWIARMGHSATTHSTVAIHDEYRMNMCVTDLCMPWLWGTPSSALRSRLGEGFSIPVKSR